MTYLHEADCRLADLEAVLAEPTRLEDYPHAADVVDGVLVYDGDTVADLLEEADRARALEAEIAAALGDGPGVLVFSGAYPDPSIIDAVTAAFTAMIDEERAAGGPAGDHFGRPGANDRLWNSLEKLAVRAPDLFVRYFANDCIALASRAWLGPAYQVTAQVNVVNPGGVAQSVHRDYHLGFQSNEVAAQYPAHVHALSPSLTLQGAVAHSDMPVESGPTMLLPHSQKYRAGYLAWRLPEFRAHFEEHHVQVPLAKGDVLVFNPALFHAAGTNRTTNVRRMANLLQVSSAFGRAMETVDRARVCLAVYDDLRKAQVAEGWEPRAIENVVAASAEGYAFPTNLDRDQPVAGLAPPSQADLVRQALAEDWDHGAVAEALAALTERTRSS